ncbi:MAG: J domain-containing protein [Bacteroidota bacterium]
MDPYQILGVTPNAGLKEIKQAFRKRASVLHPDVNSSPTAHEDFIDLTEAYENLLREKTGHVYNNSTNQYTRSSNVYSEDDLKNQARERAKQNAQMKYQEFVNSDYYVSKMSQYNTFELWVSFIFLIPLLCFQIMLFLNLSIPSAFLLFFLIVPISYNAVIVIKKTTFRQILTDTIYFF